MCAREENNGSFIFQGFGVNSGCRPKCEIKKVVAILVQIKKNYALVRIDLIILELD